MLLLDGYDGDLCYYWGMIGWVTDAIDDDNDALQGLSACNRASSVFTGVVSREVNSVTGHRHEQQYNL